MVSPDGVERRRRSTPPEDSAVVVPVRAMMPILACGPERQDPGVAQGAVVGKRLVTESAEEQELPRAPVIGHGGKVTA